MTVNCYRLSKLGLGNPEHCIIKDWPEELAPDQCAALFRGQKMQEQLPPELRFRMSADRAGMQVPDLISNTLSLLIVSARLLAALKQLGGDANLFVPVKVLNHKKRVAPGEHYVASPIGTWDVLDLQKSEIERHKGQVVAVEGYVLDSRKVAKAPAFFRVPEEPTDYFITEPIAEAWRQLNPKPTNVRWFKVRVS